MSRRVTLRDGREAQLVPADDAGEWVLSAAEGLIMHLEQARLLTWRQATAAAELARLYGIGGGRSPWRRTGGSERPEEAVEAARRDFASLLAVAPRRCQWPLTCLAMGEWCVEVAAVALWQEGTTAVADHMRLAGDDA